ncbi:MAG: HEAT repeat domain-containing protein [Myxococcota bacterium]|nr:HEAT repeat domain-containing protein [Myxococcota bacterium]
MTKEGKAPAPSPAPADDKPKAAAAVAAPAPKADKPPSLDERKLKWEELAPFGKQLDVGELTAMAADGRAHVRANAALGMAAAGHPALEIAMMLRDSEVLAASAAADAVTRLGTVMRPFVPQVVAATATTKPEITDVVVDALAALIGHTDDELTASLDVPEEVAMRSVVPAAKKVGKRGVAFLVKAAKHERSRIRINAIGGLARIGKIDPDPAMAFLTGVEESDPVPDVRTAAKQAMLAIVAREKKVAVDSLPKNIPDFEARKLSASELSEYENAINIDEMLYALQDGRAHVKINAARALAVKGEKAAPAAVSMGLNLRDSVAAVRKETAKALGKLGAGALDAAPYLVGALGDAEDDVAETASETLAGMGDLVRDALIKGLDAGAEAHGLRVGALIGKLPRAAEALTEAFKSPAVNVQVNAALGLGLLGTKVGAGLPALHGARTGGDARTREAVRRALDMIEPKGPAGPRAVGVEDFEDRFLSAAEIEKGKGALGAVTVEDLIGHLQDGRDVVRANAALALGAIGALAAAAAGSLGVRIRDDSARVRLAAAQALDKIGDAAVSETANDLVGGLRDAEEKNAEAIAAILRARKGRMVGALVRGLETDDPRHAKRIVEVIGTLPDASEILCDAFESPAVNVQVNAALGLGLLGNERVAKGRKSLEGARTGGDARTRDAVRKALDTLDGPKQSGPRAIEVEGFETRVLDTAAFGDGKNLRVEEMGPYMQDGRAVVRANAATALGVVGAASMPWVSGLGVLLRDDDMKVRIQAAGALDKIGDDAVREAAPFLVGALRGDAEVGKTVQQVLKPRKAKVLTALVKGLETDDETQARRILEVINALPDACEILCDAFDSPAENVQVNAAIGIGMLGAKRAGSDGRKKLEGARTGGFARTREAVFKGLAMLKDNA